MSFNIKWRKAKHDIDKALSRLLKYFDGIGNLFFAKNSSKAINGTFIQISKSPYTLYVRVNIKTIPGKFRILNPKNSRVICPWSS